MKVVILDAGTLGADTSLSPITDSFETTVYSKTAPEEIPERIAGFDVIITNKLKLHAENLKNASAKLICVTATGYDNIDISFCKANHIAVCNIVGYSTASVAQCAAAMVLNLAMHLPEYQNFVNTGSYQKSGAANHLIPTFHELEGKIWGIIGLGNIGKKVAAIAESFGCRVIAHKRTPDPNYTCVSLETLCKTADIITIHTPLTEDTRNLIGQIQIDQMKPNCILVNVARGAVCDEKALAEAVLNKKIAGIGIDVYSKEPFDNAHPFQKLLNLPNVCLTPHMAWGAFEARQRCVKEIAENIFAFQKGIIRNRVDI